MRGGLVAGRLASIVAFALVVAGTGFVHTKIPPTTRVDRGEAFVPRPAVAEVMAIGFDAIVADYYWLQAVQAIGGDAEVTAALGRHLGKLIDVVTTLDPWVDHPYRFAAVWLTESEENVRTANRLLERGIAHHPDEWRNRFYLGFNLFYYLTQYEAAAEQLHLASQLDGSPPYLPRLVARLRSETADIDVAEAFLLELVRTTEEGPAREGYLAALDEIEVEKKARYLEQARAAFRKLNGRDIESVDELVSGRNAVIPALPSPEPEALPPSLSRDSVWEIDPETDRIVSSWYGRRYQLNFAAGQRERAERWAEARARRAGRSGDAEVPGETRHETNEAGRSDVR